MDACLVREKNYSSGVPSDYSEPGSECRLADVDANDVPMQRSSSQLSVP
jgi:hypothetical protein